ncbi:MAG TPA: thymidine kinase [Chitinophaga sp.]
MFIEPSLAGGKRGWIEVICGSMFSGKTEELIRRLKRARIANLKVEIFKPAMDTRYDAVNIVSHDENNVAAIPIDNSQQILLLAQDAAVVGIDEAQFFDAELPYVCDQLALRGIRVIIAGLDMDYLGKPFGQMPNLLAKADYITKLHAICVKCGHIANYSYRKTAGNSTVLLGEKDVYEPRCRQHFYGAEDMD